MLLLTQLLQCLDIVQPGGGGLQMLDKSDGPLAAAWAESLLVTFWAFSWSSQSPGALA